MAALPEFEGFAVEVGREFGIPVPSPCPWSLSLAADLALDSLALVELVDVLEERFGVLASDDMLGVGTMGDLYVAFGGSSHAESEVPATSDVVGDV